MVTWGQRWAVPDHMWVCPVESQKPLQNKLKLFLIKKKKEEAMLWRAQVCSCAVLLIERFREVVNYFLSAASYSPRALVPSCQCKSAVPAQGSSLRGEWVPLPGPQVQRASVPAVSTASLAASVLLRWEEPVCASWRSRRSSVVVPGKGRF